MFCLYIMLKSLENPHRRDIVSYNWGKKIVPRTKVHTLHIEAQILRLKIVSSQNAIESDSQPSVNSLYR